MSPKRRIAVAFVISAVTVITAASAAVGSDSQVNPRSAAPAVYIDNGHGSFPSFLSRNYINSSASSNVNIDTKQILPSVSSSEKSSSLIKSGLQDSAAQSKASSSTSPRGSVPSPAAKVFFPLTTAQRDKVERVVMTSCGELGDIQMAKANAQVILDRVKSGRFGKSINEVLCAPHQFERQWKGSVNTLVKNAVASIFDRGERVTKERIYYYENPHLKEVSTAVWRRDKRYVTTIGHGLYIHEYWTDKN